MSLRMSIEDLAASGLAVTSHAENLAAALAGAADCIDAALPGWQGQSAAALTAAAANWSRASQVLLARLSEHAEALHVSAAEFWDHERRSAQALDS